MTYADQIGAWQGFYTTVAGLSAGLVGLLFVGLGLNPQIISAGGPAGMRVLAAQTFHNFLVLLVIALMALVPDTTGRSLAITLLIVGTQGVIRVALDLRRARRDPDVAGPAGADAVCRTGAGVCHLSLAGHRSVGWRHGGLGRHRGHRLAVTPERDGQLLGSARGDRQSPGVGGP
jgi:hypothetical protein